jgi:hypothetical protein
MDVSDPGYGRPGRGSPSSRQAAGPWGAAERSGSPHGNEAGRRLRAGDHRLAGVAASRPATAALEGGRAVPGAEWIWVLVWVAALFAVLVVVLRLVRRR